MYFSTSFVSSLPLICSTSASSVDDGNIFFLCNESISVHWHLGILFPKMRVSGVHWLSPTVSINRHPPCPVNNACRHIWTIWSKRNWNLSFPANAMLQPRITVWEIIRTSCRSIPIRFSFFLPSVMINIEWCGLRNVTRSSTSKQAWRYAGSIWRCPNSCHVCITFVCSPWSPLIWTRGRIELVYRNRMNSSPMSHRNPYNMYKIFNHCCMNMRSTGAEFEMTQRRWPMIQNHRFVSLPYPMKTIICWLRMTKTNRTLFFYSISTICHFMNDSSPAFVSPLHLIKHHYLNQ